MILCPGGLFTRAARTPCTRGDMIVKTVMIQAKSNHRNVLEVDQTNADLLIARGDWELQAKADEKDKEEVTGDGNGSKPAGRRRAPRASGTS